MARIASTLTGSTIMRTVSTRLSTMIPWEARKEKTRSSRLSGNPARTLYKKNLRVKKKIGRR